MEFCECLEGFVKDLEQKTVLMLLYGFSMEFSMESCEYLEGFVKKDFVQDWKQKT